MFQNNIFVAETSRAFSDIAFFIELRDEPRKADVVVTGATITEQCDGNIKTLAIV